ncbi:MAG: ornithine cyclodeaminase, partial [Ferroplasma sp.]
MITYIDEENVKKYLDIKECIEELKTAFKSYGSGESEALPRERITLNNSVLNVLPAYYSKRHLAGLKTYFSGKNRIRFVVIIFNTENPEDIYILEANNLGQRRTGALVAMVTSEIVRKKSINFTLIGSGFQAESQFLAMKEVFNLNKAYVYSRNYGHAKKFADKFGISASENLDIIKESDVITTITNSNSPIFNYSRLPDDYHINLAGSNFPFRREVAPDVLENSDMVVVENYPQALNESSEIAEMKKKDSIIELKEYIQN